MTALIETPTRPSPAEPGAMARLGQTFTDIGIITGRNLAKLRRSPQLIVFSTIQPIMFVLLFNFVFGGALEIPGVDNYINFLLPGIFAQTSLFSSTNTGIVLNEDLRTGMVDRFRSLPMARSAVLAGRTIADSVRNLFTVSLMVLVGYLIGFRFQNGFFNALLAVLLVVLFGHAFSWISANIGLRASTAETAQTAGFIWVFPLVFASSAFVPTQSMPEWLQVFANNQPVTMLVNAVRGLALPPLDPTIAAQIGVADTTQAVLGSLAWIVGLLAVFIPLATRGYRRASV